MYTTVIVSLFSVMYSLRNLYGFFTVVCCGCAILRIAVE